MPRARSCRLTIAFRWARAVPGEELREDNRTLVEFTLIPEGAGTRLRVVESGFGQLAASEEVREKALNDNSGGWPQVLGAFKKRVEETSV